VGGLVLDRLGHLPAVGEKTAWQDLTLEVVAVEGQRIDRVLVTIRPPDA